MTLQMYLLEHEMEAEERVLKKGEILKAEAVATKLIQRGRPFQEIHEDTGLPLERIHELAKISFNS